MRPTVDEQLRGLRAVLETVIAPEVTGPYPSDLLATVLGALERLEGEWGTVLRAVRDESAALDGLLAGALLPGALLPGAAAAVAAPTAAAIEHALADPPPDWLEPVAARAHYEARRALLADVVRELGPDGAAAPDLWARIVAHLRSHLAGPL